MQCSGSFSVFPPSHPLFFLPSTVFISVTGAWNRGSWLGCEDLPAMEAVFYLGAGWPHWKPLGIPGTLLPLKRGIWVIILSPPKSRRPFAILRSALLYVRGSRAKRRRSADVKERDQEIDKESAGLN